jgi:hypothetical protein
MQAFAAASVHAVLAGPFVIEALRKSHLGPMLASDAAVQSDPAGGEAEFVTLPSWGNGGPTVKSGRHLPAKRGSSATPTRRSGADDPLRRRDRRAAPGAATRKHC